MRKVQLNRIATPKWKKDYKGKYSQKKQRGLIVKKIVVSNEQENNPLQDNKVIPSAATNKLQTQEVKSVGSRKLSNFYIVESQCHKTYIRFVRPAKVQISVQIRRIRIFTEGSRFLHAGNEVSEQTVRVHRLILVFVGHTCQKVLGLLTIRLAPKQRPADVAQVVCPCYRC